MTSMLRDEKEELGIARGFVSVVAQIQANNRLLSTVMGGSAGQEKYDQFYLV
jgi:hypothetical protein